MKITTGECDFCERDHVTIMQSCSVSDDSIGVCIVCARQFVEAASSPERGEECGKKHEHTFIPDRIPGWQVCSVCSFTTRVPKLNENS